MSKLSKREKILIYIMVWLAVVILGVVYLVMPAMEKHGDIKTEYKQMDAKVKQMRALIENRSFIESEIAELDSSLQMMDKYFYHVMDNEEIDKIITGTELKSGVVPYDLEIGIGSEAGEGQQPEAPTAETPSGEAPTAEGQQPEALVPNNEQVVTTTYIAIRAEGSFEQITSFLSNAKKEKGIRVISFDFNKRDISPTSDAILDNTSGVINDREYEIKAVLEMYQRND